MLVIEHWDRVQKKWIAGKEVYKRRKDADKVLDKLRDNNQTGLRVVRVK